MQFLAVFITCAFLGSSLLYGPVSTSSHHGPSRRDEATFASRRQHALLGHVFARRSAASRVRCAAQCLRDARCRSFNFDEAAGDCELNDSTSEESPGSFEQAPDRSYFCSLGGGAHGVYGQASTSIPGSATNRNDPAYEVSTPSSLVSPEVTCPKDTYSYSPNATTPVRVDWVGECTARAADAPLGCACRRDDGTADSSGSEYPVGNTTVTCTASDAAGNTGACSFSVSVTVCSCCGPLGMESGIIVDAKITASSVLNNDSANYGPTLARFNSNMSTPSSLVSPEVTCPKDTYSYSPNATTPVRVDWVGECTARAADAPLGCACRRDDGTADSSGSEYPVGNTTVTCTASDAAGNTGACSFSVSVTVCSCCGPLGMESGIIVDAKITASSVLNNDSANYGPTLARFNSNSSWCSEIVPGTWIQVDIGRTVALYGLLIQGRALTSLRVFSFSLSYSKDSLVWTDVMEDNGFPRRFSSADSQYRAVTVPVRATSQETIRTRFIRVTPNGYSINGKCMRMELIGCDL